MLVTTSCVGMQIERTRPDGDCAGEKHLNGNGSQLRDINRLFVSAMSMANQRHGCDDAIELFGSDSDQGRNNNNSDCRARSLEEVVEWTMNRFTEITLVR